MRRDKDIAITLRKQGKTYREIEKTLQISRSTLCEWFKNEYWSKHIKKSNINRHTEVSSERIKNMNIARNLVLIEKYENVEKQAKEEFQAYKNDPLFVAGLMLYAGEGDRLDKGTIRLANTDFQIHRIFINFSKKFFKLDYSNIKFSILLYPDLDIDVCKEKWTSELGINPKNIYKPQVIQGKLKTRKLHFGVGTSIILSSFLKRKLMVWIEQAKIDLSK